MTPLFHICIDSYEQPAGAVSNSFGGLHDAIDKLFSYGVSDSDLLNFLRTYWDGETYDWDYQLAEPFTAYIELVRETEK